MKAAPSSYCHLSPASFNRSDGKLNTSLPSLSGDAAELYPLRLINFSFYCLNNFPFL